MRTKGKANVSTADASPVARGYGGQAADLHRQNSPRAVYSKLPELLELLFVPFHFSYALVVLHASFPTVLPMYYISFMNVIYGDGQSKKESSGR
jgi:hypothetical protein